MQGSAHVLRVVFPSMCTIAILIDVVVGAPLVVAANRDELHARAARPPEVIRRAPDGQAVVGGVDALSGGTWLAVRADGQLAAVTNQRAMEAAPPGLRSRGLAVAELAAAADPDAYVAALDPTAYASMNLVWSGPAGARVAYARRDARALEIEPLGRGIHVLCNDRLGAPGFPRGERLRAGIAAALDRGLGWPALAPALVPLLADHHRVPPPPSHLPPAIARELTACCIHTPAYGTRSSTIAALAPGRVLDYLHADGPPCSAPFADRRALLGGAGEGAP
jgi:uncharacterized protein with NRDE domain